MPTRKTKQELAETMAREPGEEIKQQRWETNRPPRLNRVLEWDQQLAHLEHCYKYQFYAVDLHTAEEDIAKIQAVLERVTERFAAMQERIFAMRDQ